MHALNVITLLCIRPWRLLPGLRVSVEAWEKSCCSRTHSSHSGAPVRSTSVCWTNVLGAESITGPPLLMVTYWHACVFHAHVLWMMRLARGNDCSCLHPVTLDAHQVLIYYHLMITARFNIKWMNIKCVKSSGRPTGITLPAITLIWIILWETQDLSFWYSFYISWILLYAALFCALCTRLVVSD